MMREGGPPAHCFSDQSRNSAMTVRRKKQPATSSDTFRRDLIALIPHLRAFARSLCGQRELAEDLAQNALAKAWRSQGRFQAGTNLKAWLFTILRNEFFTYKRPSWRQTH